MSVQLWGFQWITFTRDKADHSLLSIAKVKQCVELHLCSLNMLLWHAKGQLYLDHICEEFQNIFFVTF
jgi:hypothetical protein